ncbi:MAG TPA: protein YgfX [Burkholderiales bacterium]
MRAPPLRLQIAASPLLAGALSLAHGAAIACAVGFLPGWWMPALASAALTVSLVFHVRRDALQLSGDAVTEILLRDGGYSEFTLLNGDTLAGNTEGSTFVAPLLIVINVRPAGRGRRRTAVLLPDSAPAQDLRRVRVWLRHRVRQDMPASGPL